MIRPALSVLFLLAAGLAANAAGTADSDAAERQYRIARRLAAEGSPGAEAALSKVIELDPQGPLVDDALVEQALLRPVPQWPDEIGSMDATARNEVVLLLDRVVALFPDSDRAQEARYRRALVLLEPLRGYKLSEARIDLTAVATTDEASTWSARARHALAWLLEQQGEDERALAAYQRLVIDRHRDPAAVRARVGLARVLLRGERPGQAARWLDEAIDAGAPPETFCTALRELAVRSVLRRAGALGRSFTPALYRVDTGIRALLGLAPTASGGVLLGERKTGRVVELGAGGRPLAEWALADLQALAVDDRGRAFAAADTSLYRLDPGGRATRVAETRAYAPLSGLAVDGLGRFWLLDRRGQRIGRLDPGASAPQTFWEDRDSRLLGLVWDGRRAVAADGRTRSVIAFESAGRPRTLYAEDALRPAALAADPSGRLALLDAKSGQVRLLDAKGSVIGALDLEAAGVVRPAAIGLGMDGVLHVFDAAEGTWVTRP